MSTLRIIGRCLLGALAVVLPTGALFVVMGHDLRTSLDGRLIPYTVVLSFTLALTAALAWMCVRLGHFPPQLAIMLTTLPFTIVTLSTLPSLVFLSVLPLLFCTVQLALVLFAAAIATRLARRSVNLGKRTKIHRGYLIAYGIGVAIAALYIGACRYFPAPPPAWLTIRRGESQADLRKQGVVDPTYFIPDKFLDQNVAFSQSPVFGSVSHFLLVRYDHADRVQYVQIDCETKRFRLWRRKMWLP
jgi:hypothetical protein